MGYCYFGRCECYLLIENGFCVNDTIDKCIHPIAVEDCKNTVEAFRTVKYIENEPPKPNHDLVEVVRCKNCRWGRESCGNIECSVDANVNLPSEYHGYDWFCPKGERRTDG